MIIIHKNNTNNVVITVSELMLNTLNNVAIEFINETTYAKVYALLTNNISPAQGRYDEFEIIETTPNNVDEENAIIHFPSVGHWQYNCYEYNLNNAWDSSTVDSQRLIETGRCLVVGNITNVDEVYL